MSGYRLNLVVEEIDGAVEIPLEGDRRNVRDDDPEVLLGPSKTLLQISALGDVEEQAVDMIDRTVRITDDLASFLDSDQVAGLAADPVLPRVGPAGLQRIDEYSLGLVPVRFEDAIRPLRVARLHLFRGVARHGLGLSVEEIDGSVGVAPKESGRNVGENLSEVPVHLGRRRYPVIR